jgi:diguanylate cyclase (GGDEF)-like protein/PAS domain S-box-containing protein
MNERQPDWVNGADGVEWERAVQRERRLYLGQLAVFVVSAVLAVVLVSLVGRQIAVADDRRAVEEARLESLVSLRETARKAEVALWRDRDRAGIGVSPVTRIAVLGAPRQVKTFLAGDPEVSSDESAAAQSVLDAVAGIEPYVRNPPPPVGSALDRKNLREIDPLRTQLSGALDDWVELQQADVARAGDESRATVRRSVVALVGVLVALSLGVILTWFLVERQRRRIVDGIAASGEERGALIGSLQNGLLAVGPDGRVHEVNERLSEIVGFGANELVDTLPPRPFWADQAPALARLEERMQAGESGESDAEYRAADGRMVPVAISYAPLTAADGTQGGYVATVQDATEIRRTDESLRRAVIQQEALGRVAAAVAAFDGDSPEPVFSLVAQEVALLLGARAARVARYQGDDAATMVGWWNDPELGPDAGPTFENLPLSADTPMARVRRSGHAERVDDFASLPSEEAQRIAARFSGSVAAPVRVGGRLWGAVSALSVGDGVLDPTAEDDLSRFAELVGIAVSNAETRSRLSAQATLDTVTGLANHRAFHERLGAEIGRARLHGRDLSLAIVDIDRFRDVNNRFGHLMGDEVLAEMGRRLGAQVGAGEMAARIGGEKFALILPEIGGLEAWRTVDAVRGAITARPFEQAGQLTVSAGICDLSEASTPEEIIRLADGALYWAKAHGRDVAFLYSPDVVRELSAAERAEAMERAQALAGLQGLARAVDAKDPSTRRHSERVAALAVAVAKELGWTDERCRQLREAGLLHDVGKIGVPDAVLFKPGRLSDAEYEIVKKHAPLGGEIVADILSAEQASWVRHHHERVDGAGYPDGLPGDEIPDGARVLAVVDSWDVMTSVRAYSDARGREEALAELQRCSGSQFDPGVAEALIRLARCGALERLDLPSASS